MRSSRFRRLSAICLVLIVLLSACGPKKTTGGVKDGKIGQTIETFFFSFVVEDAYLCEQYEGFTPPDGKELLVARVTVSNTDSKPVPMEDMDFQAQWNDEAEEAFAIPITMDPATKKEIPAVSEAQLPYEYDLAVGETRSGDLVFVVPAGCTGLSISTADSFRDGRKGDSYFVFFDADFR